MVTAEEVSDLLAERPELESSIEAVLSAEEPFTVHDVAVDSGTFGELVAKGVVEAAESEGYRVADREALTEALAADASEDDTTPQTGWDVPRGPLDSSVNVSALRPAVSVEWILVACLVVVAGFRLVSVPSVFRESHIVLSGNDPYYYRYLIEQLAANPAVTPSKLPFGLSKGEPFFVVGLWIVSELLGGTPHAIGLVLAWYPVVSAVVTGAVVYGVAVLVSDDRRVGLAAVLMLAVLPGHALRTSLGFADHHAFDYPWLVLTLFGLTAVSYAATRGIERTTAWRGAGGVLVAVGVTGSVLAWQAGPLLIVPVGGYLALETLRATDAAESPVRIGGPVLGGVVGAAAATWGAHAALNWHTTLVAAAPALLAAGGVAVLVSGAAWRRTDLPVGGLAATQGVVVVLGAVALKTGWPAFWARLTTSVTERLLARRNITEVASLFSGGSGWILLVGLVLLVALPYMVWGAAQCRRDARWLPAVTYVWYLLGLAAIQSRFVGEFSPVLAVFAGFGFVHIAAWVDLVRRPALLSDTRITSITVPGRQQVAALAFLFLLISGVSIVQVPLQTNRVTISDAQYETAVTMAEYSDDHDMAYPANYVLSRWGWNRMYNYFVNGQSQSYGYARNNYDAFLTATDAESWYASARDRVGFVVTIDAGVTEPDTLGTRLHTAYGSRTAAAPGVGHYRFIGGAADGSRKAFALVPGAVITGTAAPNTVITPRTTVTTDGTQFTYTRRTTTNETGAFSVRVAYPGTYHVGNRTVTVTDAAVTNGTTVTLAA